MREILALLAFFVFVAGMFFMLTSPAFSGPLQDEVVKTAPTYIGTREQGDNRGKEVERILRNVGLGPGNPWCMALVYTIHKDASEKLKVPNPVLKTGLSSGYFLYAGKRKLTYKVIPSNQVLLGTKVAPADVAIWKRGAFRADGTFQGHAAVVVQQVDKKTFKSIDGNTGSDEGGDQGEGDGCFLKTRRLGVQKFLVMGFVRIR